MMDKTVYIGRSINGLDDIIGRASLGCCDSTILGLGCLGANILFSNLLTEAFFWSSCAYFLYKRKIDADFSKNREFYYKNSKEYITLEYSYRLVLKDLLKLFEELGMDNEAKIAACYNYLYKNGYLSCDKSFRRTDMEDAVYCVYLFGTNVMTGRANDRHLTSMLADLLRMAGYEAYSLSMLENSDELKKKLYNDLLISLLIDLKNYIQNDIDKDNFSDTYTTTGVTVGEHSYLMDMRLNRFLPIDEDLKLSFGSSSYNMYCHEGLNDGRSAKTKEILRPTCMETLNIRKEQQFEVQRMCRDCTDIFDRFYQEHKELYDEVVHKRKVLIKECSKSSFFRKMVSSI